MAVRTVSLAHRDFLFFLAGSSEQPRERGREVGGGEDRQRDTLTREESRSGPLGGLQMSLQLRVFASRGPGRARRLRRVSSGLTHLGGQDRVESSQRGGVGASCHDEPVSSSHGERTEEWALIRSRVVNYNVL